MNVLENMSEIEIRKKYLKAPSYDQLFSFIDELGVSYAQFELYYSIPDSVIRSIKCGARQLPVKFWPIVYERIVPQYGVSFTKVTKNATKTRHVVPKHLRVQNEHENDLHDRTGDLK